MKWKVFTIFFFLFLLLSILIPVNSADSFDILSIEIYVYDADGSPVENADVTVYLTDLNRTEYLVTNSRGHCYYTYEGWRLGDSVTVVAVKDDSTANETATVTSDRAAECEMEFDLTLRQVTIDDIPPVTTESGEFPWFWVALSLIAVVIVAAVLVGRKSKKDE